MAKKETSLQLHKIVNFLTVVSEAHSLWVALYLEGEGGGGKWEVGLQVSRCFNSSFELICAFSDWMFMKCCA